LKSFKIALTGKPLTGKSHFSSQLAQHYNVPHIYAESVLNDIEHWQDEKEAAYKARREQLLK
jgi:dephospho-CoA kinase